MIPFGSNTVTLIKRVETIVKGKTHVSYARHLLKGCSWMRRSVRIMGDAEAARADETTCRIPAGQAVPEVGDYLFLGDVQPELDGFNALAESVVKHRGIGAIKITNVADQAQPGLPMPHYAARGM